MDGQFTYEHARQEPKKYFGYPEFSKFLALAPNFLLLRRFDKLTIRTILMMQDGITRIEELIDAIDDEAQKRETGPINNGSFRHEANMQRRALLKQARGKIERYQMDVKGVTTWLNNNGTPSYENDQQDGRGFCLDSPIDSAERRYLEEPDLFNLLAERKTPLLRALEKIERFRFSDLWRKDFPKSLELRFPDGQVALTDEKKVDPFLLAVTLVVGELMLVVPLWSFMQSQPLETKMGLASAFATVFLFLVMIGTQASPHEALVITAGYLAVLMAVLQIVD
ncbi:hypothetical protein BDV18DRAFT_156571 [Aspergillus unguis]